MSRWTLRLALCGVLFLGSGAVAPDRTDAQGSDGTASPDSFAWEDPEEVAALLAELDGAGGLLTAEDWRRLGLDVAGSQKPALPAPVSSGSWQLRWREYRRSDGRSSPLLKGRIEDGRWRGVLRWRPGISGEPSCAGSLCRRGEHLEGIAGGVGFHHGLGLLCAAPGRWRTLSAAQSLAGGGEGLRSWAGAPDGSAIEGSALRLQSDFGRLDLLAGRLQDPAADLLCGDVRAGSLGSAVAGCRLSVLAGDFGDYRGGSAAVAWQRDGAQVKAERAVWRRAGDGPAEGAWGVSGRLSERLWLIEGMVAAASASGGAPLARRVAVLGGWDGSGWALRGRYRPQPSLVVRLLVYSGRHRRLTAGEYRLREETRLELAASCACGGGAKLNLRHRLSGYRDSGWGDRPLWLGPAVLASRHDEQTVVSWHGSQGDCRLWISGRTLLRVHIDDGEQCRLRRSLISTRLVRAGLFGSRLWGLRAAAHWAWGDDIDLVSAASPLRGVMLPRHWGKWIGETSLGVEKLCGCWLVQMGASARFPAQGSDEPGLLELFLCLVGGQ